MEKGQAISIQLPQGLSAHDEFILGIPVNSLRLREFEEITVESNKEVMYRQRFSDSAIIFDIVLYNQSKGILDLVILERSTLFTYPELISIIESLASQFGTPNNSTSLRIENSGNKFVLEEMEAPSQLEWIVNDQVYVILGIVPSKSNNTFSAYIALSTEQSKSYSR